MAAAVPFLPYIGMAVGALGAIGQGEAAAAGHEFNASVYAQDAIIAEQDAAFEEERHRKETRRLLSAQSAATGKAGIAVSGSPLLVMMETAAEAEIDALNIRRAGKIRADRLRAQAAYEREAAKSSSNAGVLGAGSSIFSDAPALFGG